MDHIREHIEQGLPLVPLFNIDVIEASTERGAVRLRQGEHVTRPGGSVAGPVQFALADVATYALILAVRRDAAAVTVDLTINFLRPAMTLPLVAVAMALRAGRRLFTAEVRITEEATGRLVSQATTTYALSSGEREGRPAESGGDQAPRSGETGDPGAVWGDKYEEPPP